MELMSKKKLGRETRRTEWGLDAPVVGDGPELGGDELKLSWAAHQLWTSTRRSHDPGLGCAKEADHCGWARLLSMRQVNCLPLDYPRCEQVFQEHALSVRISR